MKLVIFKKDLILGKSNSPFRVEYKAEKEYLINSDLVNVIRKLYASRLKSIEDYELITPTPLKKTKRLLLYRGGGIGDILFILPYLSSIKNHNPNIEIDFCCFKSNIPIASLGSQYLSKILPEPLELSTITSYDKVILFDNFIENNDAAELFNAYEIGSTFFEDLKRGPFVSTYKYEKPKIEDKIKIMIQFSSSTNIRDISPLTWFEFVTNLDPEKYIIIFIDSPEREAQIKDLISQISLRNSIPCYYTIPKNLEEALINIIKSEKTKPHIFIGPDSGLVHIAGYHEIPTIGLYGPFPSHLRLSEYKNAIGIDAKSNCVFKKNLDGNCFQHGAGQCKLATLRNEPYSPCLELINFKHINQALKIMLEDQYSISMDLFV